MKAVAVYCGSRAGTDPAFVAVAESLGTAIASSGLALVYGGGVAGLMGATGMAAVRAGGHVTGVVPRAMLKGEGDPAVESTHLYKQVEKIIVESMHARKVEMAKRVDAFVGLPGGFGTLEEVMEVTTWTQIGIHRKPVVLINIFGFYDPLKTMIDNGVRYGFIAEHSRDLLIFVDGPEDHASHATYDWGTAAVKAAAEWKGGDAQPLYKWTAEGKPEESKLAAT